MADKKISALPAATTPLAGTEVLPIVQGGTTDQVSVANLTAGRAVSSLSVTTTQDVTAGRKIVVTGAGMIEQNSGTGGLYFLNTAVSAGATNMRFLTTNASGVAQTQFQLNGGTTPTNQVYGDLIAETGNFKPGTAGKGIDFSAATHAAGMTSELLNDYEEGTYTVAIGCGTSGTVTLNTDYDTAQYTKVGRLVTVTGGVIVSSVLLPLGYFTISLPFTSASLSELSGYFLSVLTISGVNTANIADFVSLGVNGASSIRIYLGDATGLQGDSAQELKAGTEIYFTVSYIAA